ncbi:N-formylglutamate amidohydrolase [Pikeienuella piscinae]|uniref:N-formylglutamate amidohydrolase n=1 Tax=Pikeienuella piscinae TaxID=2748098 RepID=A0A7L5C0S8_9RHOB|nr:N-formylglutamate amidohydrolase [Pikeienuella piscinae]QIE56993.1 N-formylglutamate amidohydrolase [Pikeienuella piscinae]
MNDSVRLSAAGEDSPFEIVGAARDPSWIVLCDHASNRVPPEVAGGDLGLPPEDMARHIAYDVGARGVAVALADALGAPMVASRFSRLVIDPNRGEDDPTLLMKLYDGSIIPGNREADAAERERRLALYHRPYHDALDRLIGAAVANGVAPRLLSVHSFTPQLRGRPKRPWKIGLLWDRDDRIFRPLYERLLEEPGLTTGDNEPYSGHLQGDTMWRHGTARGLAHVLIEVRNDLIRTEAEQARWGRDLARWATEAMDAEGSDA